MSIIEENERLNHNERCPGEIFLYNVGADIRANLELVKRRYPSARAGIRARSSRITYYPVFVEAEEYIKNNTRDGEYRGHIKAMEAWEYIRENEIKA